LTSALPSATGLYNQQEGTQHKLALAKMSQWTLEYKAENRKWAGMNRMRKSADTQVADKLRNV
jgi:hypothetical protein